jgi:hypothetical protein
MTIYWPPWHGRDIGFLELGVCRGGSVPMWKGFFGSGARRIFVAIDRFCRALELPGTRIEVGDQADPELLNRVGQEDGPFDLIVEDGGHQMHQQITSFRHLWPWLADRGLHIV